MPALNPQNLSWTAPTENVDGSPIDYPLAYTLGIGDPGGPYTEVASFPGALNPDGMYEAPLPDFDFPEDVVQAIVLRAFNTQQPDVQSAWTNEVEIFVTGKLPNAPTGFSAS